MISNQWIKIIEQERKEKDRFFITNWQSPISSKDRLKFDGLVYYPPDPNYRFELKLQEHKNKKMLQIQDTTGNVRNFVRWGNFSLNSLLRNSHSRRIRAILRKNNFLYHLRMPLMTRKHTEQGGILTSIMRGTAQQMESGFLTLIKPIIRGAHIAKIIPVHL